MSALGIPVLINPNKSYWLSSIGSDVIHSTIVVDQIDANVARVSTLIAENIDASTMNLSTLNLQNLDVSGMYVSTIAGNSAFFSTLTFASDLSGGVGYVRFSVDASGIQVDGDPIRFDNLVYLTSSINIVQVSTIVDTDIFAQRGYFSTLSSGQILSDAGYFSSIVCQDISGTNGSFNRLFVSSLEALDISGVAASNWSLYPTLASSITFQPSYILSNVNNKLYFAGQELTDASGGGQDWSIFPAFSTVQMANNSITGLSTLQFQDGAKLYSVTGNNLFYNNQQITSGAGGAASNWAQYPANNNINGSNFNLSNIATATVSNAVILGDNITSGYTFTNSLGVGGLSLVPIASLSAGGDLSVRNIEVGDSATALADVNIYGSSALPGDNALYVLGGTTLTGGLTGGVPVHGTEIGALPVAGVDTVRIDVLPAGMGLNSATYIQLAAAGAGSFSAGGALSLAGGDYVEINTDDCRIINTTSGNQSTTLTVANIQMPASVAATVPLQINNTAGGGINLVGTSGAGNISGFSSITGDNLIAGNSTITNNLYVANTSFFNSLAWNNALGVSTTLGALRVNNIQIPDNITGVTNAPNPLQSRIENFSSIQSGTISTTNLTVSTINGAPFTPGSAGSTFNQLFTSSIQLSSIYHGGFAGQREILVDGNGFNFKNADPTFNARYLSSLQYILSPGINLDVQASTMNLSFSGGINPNGYIRLGAGGAADTFVKEASSGSLLSTNILQANSSFMQSVSTGGLTVSTVSAVGGLPIKFSNLLEFITPTGIENLTAINFANQTGIPQLNIYASTINLTAANTTIPSLSTQRLSTSAFNFSTATSVGSNTAYNYPLLIDYDQAQNLSTGGVAIAVQGHNYGLGAVVNRIEMGTRGNGQNYITSVWPGQNLEDLYIDATDVYFNDGNLSTIINADPYGLVTNAGISAPTILVSSINGNDARPAYTNNIQISSMDLYQNSTTLCYWDSVTTHSNINTSGYDVVVGLNGTYKIGTSLQFNNQSGTDKVEFFFLKNDNIISNAGGIVNILNNDEILTYCEIIEPLVNGDKIQVGCYTTSADVNLSTVNGVALQSPAAILTMYKVD